MKSIFLTKVLEVIRNDSYVYSLPCFIPKFHGGIFREFPFCRFLGPNRLWKS